MVEDQAHDVAGERDAPVDVGHGQGDQLEAHAHELTLPLSAQPPGAAMLNIQATPQGSVTSP